MLEFNSEVSIKIERTLHLLKIIRFMPSLNRENRFLIAQRLNIDYEFFDTLLHYFQTEEYFQRSFNEGGELI
jgi:hypothetical protein